MSIFSWFSGKQNKSASSDLSQRENNIIAPDEHVLTSADVDPEGAKAYSNFERAMELKKNGNLIEAEHIFIDLCTKPSIYKGHYRELFKIWRQFNRDDLKNKNYNNVINRVIKMTDLDSEMIQEMLRHWSIQQNKNLPKDYFDNDSNILLSDAKALKKASEELNDIKGLALANKLLNRFIKK